MVSHDVSLGVMKMKIGILGIRGIPARYGGFETFVENLSPRLVELGHDVTVYNRPKHGGDGSSFRGVRLKSTFAVHNKYLETISHTFGALWDAVFNESFDVLLICNVGNSPLLVLPRALGKPVLLNVDGLEWRRKKWPWLAKMYLRFSERIAIWTASRIVTDARVIQKYYQDRYAAKSTMIPYAADVPPANPDAEASFMREIGLISKNYFLYVSRLEPENNADLVVSAFLQVVDRLSPATELAVIGDAPYATEFKNKLVAMVTGEKRIRLLGSIYGKGYAALQRHAKAYVQATEVGGTHPALVEAMSFGNCVLALDTPENNEVTGGHALVFQSAAGLGELMVGIDQGQVDPIDWGTRASKHAIERYSWEAVTKQYVVELSKLALSKSVIRAGVSAELDE